MATNVHTVAQTGFGTGTNELYDRARPSYPVASLDQIYGVAKSTGSTEGLHIVEIGAGTGIFTRAFLAHKEAETIARLKAVEPSEGMRDVFTKTVNNPIVTIQEGTFDSTGVDDGWADLVIIAQAFHWCPDYDKACAEFARILKKNGAVIFIWNLEDREGAAWVASLRDRVESHEQGTPQFRLDLWRAAFGTTSYLSSFEPQHETTYEYHLLGTVPIVTTRAQTKSYIAVLPADEKAKVVEDVKGILAKGEGMKWIDEAKGEFEYPYKTLVIVSKRK
ncbi:S-adenosyl-L-methionine-dependent methyltransferase [Hygrophoropsis aurantiaca]|uniref:S-adenosyl-L-methionine-dependent methyltransferase n=1 Tax=Hygrophoropsis aurantiaca TaxID=72124 RepID=A0ACB7ZXV3_9AGAM|nr:S-adenosyl-L-methionine-dependent methyltransferase [Hygrophoropsis aurantiaca]